jgi:uncharacterized protein YlxW (UPF0749 family)
VISDHFEQDADLISVDPEVTLYKLESGDFRVSEIGKFKVILSGDDYILLRRDIAKLIDDLLPTGLKLINVKIHRIATNEVFDNYSELLISNEIQFDNYYDLKVSGLNIYKMFDSLIYVTRDLKDEIIKNIPELKGVTFTQGLPVASG